MIAVKKSHLIPGNGAVSAKGAIVPGNIQPDIGKWLASGVNTIVDYCVVIASGYGHTVLTGIDQYIAFGSLIRTAVITEHNAPSAAAWPAASYQIAFDDDWAFGGTCAFI